MDKDLFGNDIVKKEEVRDKPNKSAVIAHQTLMNAYGVSEGNKCKDCVFLLKKSFSKTYYKCSKFNTSSSESSDWRINWPACGLFNKSE